MEKHHLVGDIPKGRERGPRSEARAEKGCVDSDLQEQKATREKAGHAFPVKGLCLITVNQTKFTPLRSL